MRTGTLRFQADYQRGEPVPPIWFRGYVEKIIGKKPMRQMCERVHKNRAKALEDANKLLKKLKAKGI